ncbi:MAG: nickel pincer cofactor biosynthesis protein LarB [Nitrospirae bacterium]|nr:nickel pincer cofactor biosynthesis protein LarB [Nitrospirota bacterium]
MNQKSLTALLKDVQKGKVSVEVALNRLRTLPYENLGYATIDHHRSVRQGFPEVILCEGKTVAQIQGISKKLLAKKVSVLATRANADVARALQRISTRTVYHKLARVAVIQRTPVKLRGDIVIVTAGTSDINVAEEAKVTAEAMGSQVQTFYDIGVAGLHRLLDKITRLREARVIIVVAGMDGALPSVVSGLVDRPIIAVPTSRGYGANFGGIAPLLTMLNTCAAGIGVVNIDNGFGAACLAHRINVQPA